MKYKGYELTIDISEKDGCFVFRVAGLSSQSTIEGDGNPSPREIVQWFHDTVDLHIGRSAERETCEKRIDPEEVAKNLYGNMIYAPVGWENTTKDVKEYYMNLASHSISCIKKIDPSIISDDINHGVKHKFDREVLGKILYHSSAIEDLGYTWEKTCSEHNRNYWREKADKVISYIEEIIYG